MPKQTTVLQVFLASPSDVSQEREIVDLVVSELNKTWAGSFGVTYEVVKWETDVAPGFSLEPQAVINEQIPSDYDVFIGIFWGRIGSPTKGYVSGTVEEFESAYSRFKKTGYPKIMVYFKDAPLNPLKIDPVQLKAIHDFRGRLGDLGGLYSVFEDGASFEASLRSHLTAVAKTFFLKPDVLIPAQSDSVKYVGLTELNAVDDSGLDPEELGYLDYIDIYSDETSSMVFSLTSITKLMETFGMKMSKRGEQIKGATPSKTRLILRRTADDMDFFSANLGDQMLTYTASKERGLEALSQAVALHAEIAGKNESMMELRQTLQSQLDAISGAKSVLLELRAVADAIPRMTKEINKAKNTMVASLDLFLAEVDSTLQTVSNIADSIDKMV